MGKTSGFHLDGMSYRQLRSHRNAVKLNNGEPFSAAVKKTLVQLLVLFLLIFAVFLCLYGKNVINDFLTNDSYVSLGMSRKYSTERSAKGLKEVSHQGAPGYAVLESASAWAGIPVTQNEIRKAKGDPKAANDPQGMEELLGEYLPGCQVKMEKNLKNYDFLVEIHESMTKGRLVVVPMTVEAKKGDDNSKVMSYCIVESVHFSRDQLHVLTPYGRTDPMAIDDFIAATRFSKYEKSMGESLGFLFGTYSPNTAYIITKKN